MDNENNEGVNINNYKISREDLVDRIPNTRTAVKIAEELLSNGIKSRGKADNSIVKKK